VRDESAGPWRHGHRRGHKLANDGQDTRAIQEYLGHRSIVSTRCWLSPHRFPERPVKVIRLDENIGGEAFNCAIPMARSDLIHLTENDQIFLPGWHSHGIASFDAFNDLGQLSVFSDTPTDDDSWEAKPSHLRFGKRKILYEMHNNVGTSSVIRASLSRNGLQVKNIVMREYKFPDGSRLSADIKSMGPGARGRIATMCATSDMR
jgi:hypothetical protein